MNTLLFDLDGTLLNTLADLRDSTNFALASFGFSERTTEEIRSFVGNGLRMLIRHAVPAGTDEQTVDAVLAAMKRRYAAHCCDATVPYDGILELLTALKRRGCATAIVSNKADAMVQLLRAKYFEGLIDFAVGERNGLRRKPSPDLAQLALSALGRSAEAACYIGDSEVDLQTAKNAGIPCLSVGWGFRVPEALTAAGAEHVWNSPAELTEFLMKALP